MATGQASNKPRPGQTARPATRPGQANKKSFVYHDDDDPAVVSQHAVAPTGAWDSIFKPGIPIFRPKADLQYTIRILPRTFDYKALASRFKLPVSAHWGLPIAVHNNIGPVGARASYLCRQVMFGIYCPLCNERQLSAGDPEALKALRVSVRWIAWLVDRKNLTIGPQVWNMPPSQVEQEICKQQADPETRSIINITHPIDGFDLTFDTKKQQDFTTFTGIRIARNPSPVSDDPTLFGFENKRMSGKWAEFINENSLDQIMNFYEDAYVLSVYNGEARRAPEDEPQAPIEASGEQGNAEAATDQGVEGEAAPAEEEQNADPAMGDGVPSPEEILEMDEEALAALCESINLGFDMADYNDIDEARDAVLGEFHPDWQPSEDPDPEPEPEPQPEVRRPAARRPAPAAAPAAPAAAAAKPATAVKPAAATNGAKSPAEQATARLKEWRERNAGAKPAAATK